MSSEILSDWLPEREFARKLRERTGFGAVSTLQRWRLQGTIPEGFVWKKVSRAVLWREKPEMRTAPAE
jgi:hypothetical protein